VLIGGACAIALASIVAGGRPRVLPWIAGAGSGLLGLTALYLPPDASLSLFGQGVKLSSEFIVLGRTLSLSEANRGLVAFLFLAGAFLFVGAAVAKPGRHLFWAGPVMMAALACALMIEPFLYAAVFLMVAAMAGALILVDTGTRGQRGGIRLLAYYSLAMMAILLAGWLLARSGVSAGAPELTRRTGLLLALGVAVVLLVPPFHLWLPAAMDESHPYGVAFILLMLNASGLFFLLRLVGANPWLREVPSFFDVFRVAGLGMMAYGSLTALAQRRFGRMLAYLTVVDGGAALIALSAGDTPGYVAGLGLTSARVLSLGCWALGLSVLRTRNVSDDAADLAGALMRHPWASGATLMGALGMAAYPMTSGFPGRWGVLLGGGPDDPARTVVMMVSGALAVAAVLRWTGILVDGEPGQARGSEGWMVAVLLGGGVVLVLLVGAFPQVLYPWLARAAAGLAGAGP
jgi:formate hydrogenlyase subunit 3/multisubunit Na+/H+ antiporter MnhD subunit